MKFTPSVLITILILPILFYFHFTGVVINDEGYVLNSAQRVIDGSVIYRDFHFNYTPLSVFSTSIAFFTFGESILSSRVLMLSLSFLSSILIFLIIKNITKRTIYAIISMLIFLSWGPTHTNFAWPTMFVLPLTLIVIYLILAFDIYKIRFIPFFIGFVSFLVLLSSQNFGIILLSSFAYFISIKKSWIKNVINTTLGFLWGLIFFVIYLLSTNSFGPFLSDFYTFTVSGPFLKSELTNLILSTNAPLESLTRALLYFIPPASSIGLALLLIYRKKYKLLFIPVLTFSYYIVGIGPTHDYSHLILLLSLSGLPITIFINKLPTFPVKTIGYLILIFLIITGFHVALLRNYYLHNVPLAQNASFLGEKVSIITNTKFTNDYRSMKRIIDSYTRSNDYIYINSYAPMLYFVFDRRNPTPYDFPVIEDSGKFEKITVYSLVAKDVKLVFLTSKESRTKIEEYVHQNYELLGKVAEYYAYLKP